MTDWNNRKQKQIGKQVAITSFENNNKPAAAAIPKNKKKKQKNHFQSMRLWSLLHVTQTGSYE